MENEYQRKILNRLMFAENLRYKDLHAVVDDHNLFNHHLRELQDKKYIKKKNDGYSLTNKGRKLVSSMEEDGTLQGKFKVSTFIYLINPENSNEVLLHKRLEHPHYGYTGSISGKVRVGESLKDVLIRELKEEINIKPLEYTLLGNKRVIFRDNDGGVGSDCVFYVCVVEKYEGTPELNGIEGEYFWCEISKVLDQEKMFKEGMTYDIDWLQKYLTSPEDYKHNFVEIDYKDLQF